MSIRQRIEDAVILDSIRRKDGALLSVLIAVAATSRLRYPKGTKSNWKQKEKMGDGEAFQTFFKDESESVYGKGLRLDLSSPCPDPTVSGTPVKTTSHGKILYKYVRCELVHAGKLPHTIEFRKQPNTGLYAAYVAAENKFVLSETWLSRLIRAVVFARENDGVFEQERKTSEVLVNLAMPFVFTRHNVTDLYQALGESEQQIDRDFNTTFSHRF